MEDADMINANMEDVNMILFNRVLACSLFTVPPLCPCMPVLDTFQSVWACGILLSMVKDSKSAITPLYYNGDDVMQIIERYGLDFCLGNSIKYILRAGHKHDNVIEDLKKALWYLERKIQQLRQQQQIELQEKDKD